ncbi:MAG: hypothetical protein HXY30_03405 [Pseudorhodoplanes sp.]|nr:hypothetical protein [Pseudorhodoplanes sp.]
MADRPKTSETQIQRIRMQRAADGKQAMLDYEGEAAAIRVKTARLKALRLAAEAAAAGKVAVAKPKAKAAKRGRSSATLSDWLKGREADGF